MMSGTILRVAAGAVLASCLFALHSRDARGLPDPTAYQLVMDGQSTCITNSNGNNVGLEAHGFDANQNDVCEVAAFLDSGHTVSTTCPTTVRSHKAWITERAPDYHIVSTYVQSSTFVLWPTTAGQSTTNGPISASISGSGCGTAYAYSIGYLKP